jgi:ubiquinone/menaquinone biosynthesis C-methylase UbiE
MNKEGKLTRKVYGKKAEEEWGRLIKDPFHRLEFDTTTYFLKKFLPKKGLILDAGGGPGRYTIELAKQGYNLSLLDFTPQNLEIARKMIKKEKVQNMVKKIISGSITDLSAFGDNTFDAVLCLGGPLSHVHPEKARAKAIKELVRVAKSGAPIFISVMSKFGGLLTTPIGWPSEVGYKKHFEKFAYKGDDYMWWGGGFCHFFTSNELQKLVLKNKVKILEKVGLEGLNISKNDTNKFARNYPKAYKNWLEIHYKLCTNPFVVDASGHMLFIFKKK